MTTDEEDTPPPVSTGTILEAAFVDLNYPWPLSTEEDGITAVLQEPDNKKNHKESKKPTKKKKGWGLFRRKTATSQGRDDISVISELSERAAAVTLECFDCYTEEELRGKNYVEVVPEGALIYRLDTSTHKIQLISAPPPDTDYNLLLREMVVAKANGSDDASRRGIDLIGMDGKRATLHACSQRTATAWLEALSIMHRPVHPTESDVLTSSLFYAGMVEGKDKTPEALDKKEKEYLSLALFSHNLVMEGAFGQFPEANVGGAYYNIHAKHNIDCKTMKSKDVIRHRVMMKDSWEFYRVVCGLIRDKMKYNDAFRTIQHDPVYPYLNSLTGLNDPGDDGYENIDKAVSQYEHLEYTFKSKKLVAEALAKQAEETKEELLMISKSLASAVGAKLVALAPTKTAEAAIRKAERKYDGDLLKVTDYCGALMVVDDLAALLAVLELARDRHGDEIRRIKLSSLKTNHRALPGGYRDCKINMELNNHICEIQIHLKPMWDILGVSGYKHYRKSVEYSTGTFTDPFNALKGMDSKKTAELLIISEEAVVDTPLENLKWQQEEKILDYFAQTGILIKHGLHQWAEVTLKKLIDLRIESPEIGREHHTTLLLYKYLEEELLAQGKTVEAESCSKFIRHVEEKLGLENRNTLQKGWDSVLSGNVTGISQTDIDNFGRWVIDPSYSEREAQENAKKEVSTSKKAWRSIRAERFPFLLPPEQREEQEWDNSSQASKRSLLKRIGSRTRSQKPLIEVDDDSVEVSGAALGTRSSRKKRRKHKRGPIVLQDIEIGEGEVEIREKVLAPSLKNRFKSRRRKSGVPKVSEKKQERDDDEDETPSLSPEYLPSAYRMPQTGNPSQGPPSLSSEDTSPSLLQQILGFDDRSVATSESSVPNQVTMVH